MSGSGGDVTVESISAEYKIWREERQIYLGLSYSVSQSKVSLYKVTVKEQDDSRGGSATNQQPSAFYLRRKESQWNHQSDQGQHGDRRWSLWSMKVALEKEVKDLCPTDQEKLDLTIKRLDAVGSTELRWISSSAAPNSLWKRLNEGSEHRLSGSKQMVSLWIQLTLEHHRAVCSVLFSTPCLYPPKVCSRDWDDLTCCWVMIWTDCLAVGSITNSPWTLTPPDHR